MAFGEVLGWLVSDAVQSIPLVNMLVALALFVSAGSLIVSIRAYRRSARIERYDYAVRLQILDEQPIVQNAKDPTFTYSARLVNASLKPARIDRVYLDCGGETIDTSTHFAIDRQFDLPPDKERWLRFSLSRSNYEKVLAQFGIEKCSVHLRVRYFNVSGDIVEVVRPLVSIWPDGASFSARGETLT